MSGLFGVGIAVGAAGWCFLRIITLRIIIIPVAIVLAFYFFEWGILLLHLHMLTHIITPLLFSLWIGSSTGIIPQQTNPVHIHLLDLDQQPSLQLSLTPRFLDYCFGSYFNFCFLAQIIRPCNLSHFLPPARTYSHHLLSILLLMATSISSFPAQVADLPY